ncbi:MAG: hypothetical protein Q8P81_03475 [Nanoarchaeota archaeon]|nr:hypothetical protein [Nanoarchaeota archaeon]
MRHKRKECEFKVGDLVEIIKPKTNLVDARRNLVLGIRKFEDFGKIGIVCELRNSGMDFLDEYNIFLFGFEGYFLSCELKLLSRKK